MLQVIEVKTLITLAVRTHPNPCVPNAPEPLLPLLFACRLCYSGYVGTSVLQVGLCAREDELARNELLRLA